MGEVDTVQVDPKRLVVVVDIPPTRNSIIVTNVDHDTQGAFRGHVRNWGKADEVREYILGGNAKF